MPRCAARSSGWRRRWRRPDATYRVTTYYGSGDESLVSPDKDATVLTIGMGPDAEDGIEDVIDVVQQADRGPYEVSITGEFTADNDFLDTLEQGL